MSSYSYALDKELALMYGRPKELGDWLKNLVGKYDSKELTNSEMLEDMSKYMLNNVKNISTLIHIKINIKGEKTPMIRFIRLILKISIGILFMIIAFLIFILGKNNYNDYNYSTPDDFLNSKTFSWYDDIFPRNSNNIFLRTFIETNEMIVIFDVDKINEIPSSQLYTIPSINRGIEFLKSLNIPDSKKQYFIDNKKIYCYFNKNKSSYLVSKYYSNNNDIAHYMFVSLHPKDVLEICQ